MNEQPTFQIPLNSRGKPDFLWVAFQTFLSSSPDSWDGDTIYSHIESDKFDMECSKKISIWYPFVQMPKDEFLEAVCTLEEMHCNSYLTGLADGKLDNPPQSKRKGKSKTNEQ